MAVRGWVQGCAWQPRGSELTADATAGATVLHVEDLTDFDDDPGSLSLNDQLYTYSAGAVDEDAGTITLDVGIVADATVGDGVYAVSGGQLQRDVILFVSCGDGDAVEVVVGYAQRHLWLEGDYDDPVQVILSDDLELVNDVPGRIPGIAIDSTSAIKFYSSSGDYQGQVYGPQGVQIEGPGGAFVRLGAYHDGETVVGGTGGLSVSLINGFGGSLTVGSDVHCLGTVTADGDLTAGGNVAGEKLFASSPDTTDNAANVRFGTGGQLLEVSSSAAKYKDNITPLTDDDLDPDVVVQLAPHSWTYRPEHCSSRKVQWGAIADHAHELGLTKFVEYDEETGEVENFRYDRWPMAQQAVLRQHHQRIADLEDLVARLASRVEQLEAR